MKKTLLFIFVLMLSGIGFAQSSFWKLDFEETGGYTTSVTEFTDLGGDYFTRTDGTTIGDWIVYTNKQGNYFFGAQDMDGDGASIPQELNINDIDISGRSITAFSVYLADALASDGNFDWDDNDYVKFQYDVDNSGTFTDLFWIYNDGSQYNTQPSVDADMNGVGDGSTLISANFTEVNIPFDVSGSTLDIKIIFSLNGGDEDIAVDNISLIETVVASDLFISEYVEGKINGNNRVIEIFNGTGAEVDLSAYTVKQSHNGTGWGVDGIAYVLPLTGTLADGDVFVIANETADASVIAVADLVFAYADTQGAKIPFFTGNDAIGLFKDETIIDVVGVETESAAWAVAGVSGATQDHTIIRKRLVTEGNTNWTASAGTNTDDSEWTVFDNATADKVDDLGTHTFGPEPEPTTIDVTFNVDMNGVTSFVAGTDHLYIAGTIAGNWTGPGDAAYEMTDANTDGIYTITLELPEAGDIAYKYFINAGWDGGEWAGDPNRSATIEEETTLNDVFGKYIYNVALATAPFYAGDEMTITWGSKGSVADVKIEAFIPSMDAWEELFASTTSDGTELFTIPADAWYSDKYVVRISDVTNADAFALSAEFEIIAMPSIYDVQFNTTDGDASEYKGQKVVISGVVTALAGSNFWIQAMPLKDSQYPAWSGIYGYDVTAAAGIALGDDVTFEAKIDEYFGATEIVSVTIFTVNSSDNVIDPVAVTAVNALEAYESTLITIENAEVTSDPNQYGEFTVNDGTADYIVDDKIFAYTPTIGDVLDITGVTTYANSNFKLYPRSAEDVVVVIGVGIENLLGTEFNIYPNPSKGVFYVQLGDAFAVNTKIEVFNLVGMKVMEVMAFDARAEIDLSSMKQGVYYVRVDDGETIHTQKVMKQ